MAAGSTLFLDFVNTVDGRDGPSPQELLGDYEALVSWSGKVGILSGEEQGDLRAAARADPGRAATALREARALREEIYAVFASLSPGDREPALAQLAKRVGRFLARAAVEPKADGGFGLRFPVAGSDAGLEGLLGPIAWSAFDLLLHGEPARVKVCEGENCGWLFLDESKNRSRKWCSMESCGNRAKAQRHYHRTQPKA